jgi:hypothetical protein
MNLSNTSPTLVVMAAGMGSRYGGLKQIEPVGPGGEAVLDYSVFDARRAGFGKVVFVIRREIEETFRAAFGRRFESRLEVRYAFQELDRLPAGFRAPAGRQKPWGTGHALLCACEVVAGPCAVINADDFYGAESYEVLGRFLSDGPAAGGPETYGMVGYRLGNTLSEHGAVARGVCRTDAESFLASVEELTAIEKLPRGAQHREPDGRLRPLTGDEVVSVNFWGFTPSIGAHLQRLFTGFLEQNQGNPKAEFYIPTAVNCLINEGAIRVKVLPTRSPWFGVTYREDRRVVIENIRALIEAGAYPERLWE